VLKSIKDKKMYTGCTEDLRKRFREHNIGKVNSTKA
jgi:predicted GIY-YIG superfamily endonuclease